MIKQKKLLRDNNGTFILPLISIARKSIDQSQNVGGLGRGIGQNTGELVIKKRLDKTDRRYQAVKNKLNLKNQTRTAALSHETERAVEEAGVEGGTVGTRRNIGARRVDKEVGDMLRNKLDDNIFEVITIPYPEFFSLSYEVTIWTQYQQHMNRIIEQLMSSYNGQGNQFKIETDKGYWFVAFIDDAITAQDNFDDYSEEERIIQYTFTVKTTGYLVGQQHEGMQSPLRRFVSAPSVSFGVSNAPPGLVGPRPTGNGTGDINKFILSDVVELDKGGNEIVGRNHSPYGEQVLVEDPFSGERERRFLRVKTRNQRKGETVLGRAPNIDLLDNIDT